MFALSRSQFVCIYMANIRGDADAGGGGLLKEGGGGAWN